MSDAFADFAQPALKTPPPSAAVIPGDGTDLHLVGRGLNVAVTGNVRLTTDTEPRRQAVSPRESPFLSAPDGGWSGFTHAVDGTDLVSPTRQSVYNAVKGSSGFKVQSLRGIDLKAYGATFMPMGYNVQSLYFDDSIRHHVITFGLTTQERSDLIDWLLSEAA